MLADLAVLSRDIFKVAADSLPGTVSVLTIIGGRIRYDALTAHRASQDAQPEKRAQN